MKKYFIILLCLIISMFVFAGCDFAGLAEGEAAQEESIDDDKKIKTFDLYNNKGEKICEFCLPSRCNIETEGAKKTSYEIKYNTIRLSKIDYFMLNISSTASNEVGNYIVDGKVPNKTRYPNFECEYETIDNNGIQYYKTHYSVEDFDGKTDSYCVLVPYTDMNGNLCFIVIELDEAFYDGWDKGNGNIIAYLLQNTQDGEDDSLIEEHEIVKANSTDIDTMTPYDEIEGEFTLFDDKGYKISTFKFPKGYKLSSYSDDGRWVTIEEKIKYQTASIKIHDYVRTPIYELLEGEIPDSKYYKEFECEYTEEVLGNYECMIFKYKYKDSGEYYEKMDIAIAYAKRGGEIDYIDIEIPTKIMEQWDSGGKDIIIEMLGG